MNDKKENVGKYIQLFRYISHILTITKGYSMLDVIRASELLIADCIAQSNASQEVEEITYASIGEDVKKFAEVFKEQHKQDKSSTEIYVARFKN